MEPEERTDERQFQPTEERRSRDPSAASLLELVELLQIDATRRLDPKTRGEKGQFLTPLPVASFMASMFDLEPLRGSLRLLDAGAGIGSLSAAFVARVSSEHSARKLDVIAYETEPLFIPCLEQVYSACRQLCESNGIEFGFKIHRKDFISAAVSSLEGGLFVDRWPEPFEATILNPPYRKIRSDSPERLALRRVAIETSNLYSAFLSLALKMLRPDGEMVAITPRSFCNGPYFRPFRKLLLNEAALRRIHVFERRDRLFSDDEVLQENLIFHAVKGGKPERKVIISTSEHQSDREISSRQVAYDEVVRPRDPESFIHVTADDLERQISERMEGFRHSVDDLDLSVSTGRVVDFRAERFLRDKPQGGTVPLIYPECLKDGSIQWPKVGGRKPSALLLSRESRDLLVPAGDYVLVKRFSAKEERRRVVAAVFRAKQAPPEGVGFENHLNYFHQHGGGLPIALAQGLAIFLNSTLVDMYFRQFSGHTQVNATDLRKLRYPSREALEALGSRIRKRLPRQEELDRLIREELLEMADDPRSPLAAEAKRKISEALHILKEIGLPSEQQNERSALTLLSLLDLKADTLWSEAGSPKRGITQMMDFFSEHYGKKYAPNTRETVRRFTVHQFVQAGFIIPNPDEPSRPTNSPNTVYQVEPAALDLLRMYGTGRWRKELKKYLTCVETLSRRYARDRSMRMIPVRVAEGTTIKLSPGGQSVLVKRILDELCPRFTPGAKVIYIGDTGDKWAYFDAEALKALGVRVEQHGKMPDLVVHDENRNWLVLIEAVTSHGPVNPKRRTELNELFKGSNAGLVFVTAFLDRKTLPKYLRDVAWETEVWLAEAPSHMIHFNGERFLGPYEEPNE